MIQTARQSGITFPVDDVTPAVEPLKECKTYEAVGRLLGSKVESCWNYHSDVVTDVHSHALLMAVHQAFSDHRPLVLSPDVIWITIVQGVAHHMALHGERLRSRFVRHEGKLKLVYSVTDWVERTPENPWPQAFESWSQMIRAHVGDATHNLLRCDFGTTGPAERAASDIVMMDIFERYFHYQLLCICGIPSITLQGSPSDWRRLREKAAGLRIFDMDWWLAHLLPICDQFVAASEGIIDRNHWQGICKLREEYGGDIINGWIVKLFPYVQSFINGPCRRRNPIFETGEGIQSLIAPPGLSRVPFTWRQTAKQTTRPMEAIGGLVGIAQHSHTLALRPQVGWAVREAQGLTAALARLDAEHTTFAGVRPEYDQYGHPPEPQLPRELEEFYFHTNGAELFGRGDAAAYRFISREQVRAPEQTRGKGWLDSLSRLFQADWHGIVQLRDGSWLAMNLQRRGLFGGFDPDHLERLGTTYETFAPICRTSRKTWNCAGKNRVIALSLSQLLTRMLDSNGNYDWLEAIGNEYGDAEDYMPR